VVTVYYIFDDEKNALWESRVEMLFKDHSFNKLFHVKDHGLHILYRVPVGANEVDIGNLLDLNEWIEAYPEIIRFNIMRMCSAVFREPHSRDLINNLSYNSYVYSRTADTMGKTQGTWSHSLYGGGLCFHSYSECILKDKHLVS